MLPIETLRAIIIILVLLIPVAYFTGIVRGYTAAQSYVKERMEVEFGESKEEVAPEKPSIKDRIKKKLTSITGKDEVRKSMKGGDFGDSETAGSNVPLSPKQQFKLEQEQELLQQKLATTSQVLDPETNRVRHVSTSCCSPVIHGGNVNLMSYPRSPGMINLYAQ